MRSVATALAWEFWSANRRGWLIVLGAIPLCAVLYRLFGGPLQDSDGLRSLSYLPLGMSLILAIAFCNFTDRSRRSGISGFPQHLFARPVDTRLLVTALMACAVASVVGIYVAWVQFVFQPVGIELMVRWPVTLLAAGIVFYQAIIWCMSGYRLTRVVTMSLMVVALVWLGFLPFLPRQLNPLSEMQLTVILGSLVAVAYTTTVFAIDVQRRGGGRGIAWGRAFVERFVDAVPRRQFALTTADRALFWMEWRRSGLVLPAAVLLTANLILGPVLWMSGRGADATLRAALWLAALPVLLAVPVGKGLAKPDFWSLELALSPFIAARPVTGAQIIAAKMKSAAVSSLLAWTVLLVVAPAWLFATCDLDNLRDLCGMFHVVYTPISLWVIPFLVAIAAILATWSLLVGSLWIGYSGRPALYYSFVGLTLAVALTVFIGFIVLWVDVPEQRDDAFVALQPVIPWLLAVWAALKCWSTAWTLGQAQRQQRISSREVATYFCFWLAATGCLMLLAYLLSPNVVWLRNILFLAALVAVPSTRLAAALLAIAWNRHG